LTASISGAIDWTMVFCWACWVAADKADLRERWVNYKSGAIIRHGRANRRADGDAFAVRRFRLPLAAARAVNRASNAFDAVRALMYNPLFPGLRLVQRYKRRTTRRGVLLTFDEVSNHVRGHKNRWQAIQSCRW